LPLRHEVALCVDDREARGLAARDRASLSSHATWSAAADRADPVAQLEAQDNAREPDLVPVRHGRMMVSPFSFYRGAVLEQRGLLQTFRGRDPLSK